MFVKIKWLILAIFITLPISALALTGYSSDFIILEKDEVIEGNYYAAGNTVEINGTVNGDVFVAGETIIINSENINGDVFAAASSIDIKGKIKGSLRLIGENIDVMAEVSRNIMVAAKNLRLDEDAKLFGHLTFWGEALNMAGEVGRLEGAFKNMRLSGTVNNDVDVYLAESTKDTIRISNEASIGGVLYYQAFKEIEINSNATIGSVSFNKIIKTTKSKSNKSHFFALIVKFFGMLIVGMIILHLWPRFLSSAYGLAYKEPSKTFFKGLLLLIVTPLASILVAVTIIGLPIAIIGMLTWVVFLYVAKILAAWLLGKFIKDKFFSKAKWSNLLILAFGLLLYIFVTRIPIIGFLLMLITDLLAWGSFANLFKFKKD